MAEIVQRPGLAVRKVWKLFLFYSFGVFLQYSAYGSLLSLQSSINVVDGLGTYCASVINITAVLFTIFCVPTLLRRFGAKKCFCWCECAYFIYTVANMYPTYYTMLPASFLAGIADSTLWSTMPLLNSYFAKRYSALVVNGNQAKNESRFSGYFYAIVLGSKIPGNIIAYSVLYAFNTNPTKNSNSVFTNFTIPSNDSDKTLIALNEFKNCGANDCQDAVVVQETVERYVPENKLSIYVLMGVLTSLCVVAVVIHFIFIPETGSYGVSRRTSRMQNSAASEKLADSDGAAPNDEKHEVLLTEDLARAIKTKDQGYISFAFSTVKDIGKQVVNLEQLLVTPIFIYHGLTYGFITSELTRSYTTCAFGVAMVPIHFLFNGIGAILVCFVLGKLGKRIGRDVFFAIASLVDGSIYIYGLLWSPTSSTSHWSLLPMYFFLGGMQGIWISNAHVLQINYFPHKLDVACPVWNIYYMLGIAIQFAWSTSFCVRTKIFIQMGVLVCSMIGYVIAETLHRRNLNKKRQEEEEK